MEVLVLQTDIKWLDASYNLIRAGILIEEAFKAEGYSADMIVLPEMFATGFCMEPEKCSHHGDTVLGWMKDIAAEYDAAVAGTVAVEEPEGYRNRFFFVRPGGMVTYYDKRHLFTFAGENDRYEGGNRRVVVRWKGVDILLQTCYDLRFPVFARNTGDYQLAIYCASWVDKRISVWDILLRARAIENVSYVIGSNRVGEDPAGLYPGHSVILDFKGNVLAEVEGPSEGFMKYSLSLEELHHFREKFPVLDDEDEFVLA